MNIMEKEYSIYNKIYVTRNINCNIKETFLKEKKMVNFQLIKIIKPNSWDSFKMIKKMELEKNMMVKAI